ncbi:DUF3796 domain-containing protein [Ruminococcaceae bacterium OttesenSCG-928-D13]|nr:DUF3796 domain-containing protein [Ruminococcaceae bacterium OttesenSCG-928-D13]
MEYDASPRRLKVLGCMGFLGLMGCAYFFTGWPGNLAWFAYFGYFSYFIIARMAVEMPDERYHENLKRARSAMFPVVLWGLFVVIFVLGAIPMAPLVVWVITLAAFFVLCNLIFALLFRHYELKG